MKKKKRILYVDDDEEIIFVQKSILERFGYEVSIYSNPLAALEQFQAASEKYDIAIKDQIAFVTRPNCVQPWPNLLNLGAKIAHIGNRLTVDKW